MLKLEFIERNYLDYYSNSSLFDWTVDANADGVVSPDERDGSGNILKILDRVTNDGFYATMNDFNELVSYARPSGSSAECTYNYDGGGNRLNEDCANVSATYTYDAGSSRLTSTTWSAVPGDCSASTPVSIGALIDDAGNVTQYAKNGCPADVHTIDYDASGIVSGFDGDPSTAVTYDERHLARTMGTGRKLTYDQSGRILADATADALTEYVWADNELIAVVYTVPPGDPMIHAVATDHLGAPWRSWDSTKGELSWSVSYAPFGPVTPSDGFASYSPTPAIALRRPGQLADASSGCIKTGGGTMMLQMHGTHELIL